MLLYWILLPQDQKECKQLLLDRKKRLQVWHRVKLFLRKGSQARLEFLMWHRKQILYKVLVVDLLTDQHLQVALYLVQELIILFLEHLQHLLDLI
jgi:hypothetical protein